MDDPGPSPSIAGRASSFAFVPITDLDRRPYRILVVDDDPDALALLERTLLHANDFEARVTTARDATGAREKLAGGPYDVVIADQVMPDVNGIELLIEVREAYPDMLRLLITAFPSLGTVLRAVNLAQVHSYIEKPFDPRLLNRTVYEALLRRQERKRTHVINAHGVEEAIGLLQDFEKNLPGASTGSNRPGVTFSFDSPVDFNRFVFEVIQAKNSAIRDVHVFEGRYLVTVTVLPIPAVA